jgi:trimethylamine--corrinoid protein Co-methyltransferase
LAGVQVDANTLAFDAYREVQPAGHFLGCSHTMANYTSAFYDSTLSDDRPFETWSEDGSQDSAQRANRRWKTALAEYQAPDIDPGVDESIREYIDRKKAAMPDQWY